MKKRLAMICICAAAISLAGCGKGEVEPAESTQAVEEAAAEETATETAKEVEEPSQDETEKEETEKEETENEEAGEAEPDTNASKEETQEQSETAEETEDTVLEETEEEASDEAKESALPKYEYPGPEGFYSVMYDYLRDEIGKDYPDADVTIPCPVIVKEVENNDQSVDVYGDFWVLKYNLEGEILECSSGGSYPGCMHFKTADTDCGYEVTGFDVIEDGENSDESARDIFGEYYDAYSEMRSDTENREAIRAQIISNYVFANKLNITAYQDFGWDPVTLPDENIDSFYSQLD